MNLVLIGYRGTGKSVISEILERRLGMARIGMDAEIERRAGLTIPRIVEKHGWPGFRDLEADLARELGDQDGLVIDTGGGVIERPQNMENLKKNGMVFWLTAPVSVIVSRIQKETHRPALVAGKTFVEEVGEVLARRIPLYQDAADHAIDTGRMSPEAAAAAIIGLWPATL